MLQVASKVFEQAMSARAGQLSNSVRLLAADFGFRQAIALAEQETLQSVLENHGNRINASLSLLLAVDGELLASTNAQLDKTDIMPLFSRMQQQDAINDILLLDGKAYQLVLVPVRAPQIIGWVGMDFEVDQALAVQIKGITGLDISFALQDERANSHLTSTLTPRQSLTLTATLQQLQQSPEEALADPAQNFISKSFAIDQQQQLWAMLHLPNERWLASYQQLRLQLLQVFGIGLTLALIAAFLFAGTIAKPLAQLTSFARAIGQGKSAQPPKSSADEVGILTDTLVNMQQAIKQRETLIRQQAEEDLLTGLANRLAVEHQLPALLQQPGYLIQLNILKFKHINDALGIQNGDLLLQQLAARLRQLQPAASFLARLGGDEFVLVYQQALSDTLLQQLYSELVQPFDLKGSYISLKLAMGIYPFTAATSLQDALRRVDIALNNARQGQDESHQRELQIIAGLPAALSSDQLFVVYQPKVDIQLQQCQAAEALIRWQHPELGFLPPDEFIALAEHSGNIQLISRWMLNSVISQLALWLPRFEHLKIAVNLSAADLLDHTLPQLIAQLLQQHKVSAKALTLEVTESAVMQDTVKAVQILQQLGAMGIELAIDDFGTGQSSLAYLKQLPVHELKIDRAFVKDIEFNQNDALIVQASTQLAKGLGLTVTAEGLENQAGLQALLDAGCDKVQGYFFSKPLPAQMFSSWLEQFSNNRHSWFNKGDDTCAP
ncbi:putative bifunctional diguanylate cyclase/phosphodiesterase [Arsukibacterium sp.]|uniref:putative bifunctional diguanylate cyclase/phosphodiesterase n=1 Tax=Arsukibacterium sp. TaxID=1977258 RepID=UPI002FD9EA66